MPRTRYLTLEEAVERLFEDDTDDAEQSDIVILVCPPETSEASDEEELNDNISNHDNDDLPCDTADKLVCQAKKKSPGFMACKAYMTRFIGILANSTQSICARLYTYHDFPDISRAKMIIQRSKKIGQDKKKVRIIEKWPMYNAHKSKFHDVHLNF
ncbi:hypothetical protein AVEN_28326-1 [Araneus ventricosus]|uniref:PiggyBac transposable element-derived protein domain-containing protein n=1 Tax=Araneus ventricosus TaxID=182803 RepID=A0A4Y2DJM5_ARAVE|nr:hypothetical protein AVEN_28326-1 [Araneus ventricosus]